MNGHSIAGVISGTSTFIDKHGVLVLILLLIITFALVELVLLYKLATNQLKMAQTHNAVFQDVGATNIRVLRRIGRSQTRIIRAFDQLSGRIDALEKDHRKHDDAIDRLRTMFPSK